MAEKNNQGIMEKLKQNPALIAVGVAAAAAGFAIYKSMTGSKNDKSGDKNGSESQSQAN